MAEKTGYRPDIDGLRAIAVCVVVFYHAFPSWLPGGFVGVDIFFVISGFLIGGILIEQAEAQSFSYKDFIIRRIRRIIPALTVVLAATMVVASFLMVPEDIVTLGRGAASGALFVANILLWSEVGYTDAAAEMKPLLHLWSLGVEEQFYIFWPCVIWAAWRWVKRPWLVIAALGAGSLALSIYLTPVNQSASFYLPFTRFWELIAGTLLALWSRHHTLSNAGSVVASLCGFACIFAALTFAASASAYPGWHALIPVIGTVLLIAAGPSGWVNRSVLSLRPMVGIGLISYSFYLWHWPVLTLLKYHTMYLTESFHLTVFQAVFGILLSALLAYLTFAFIERKTRHVSARPWQVRAVLVSWLVVTIVCVTPLAIVTATGGKITGSKDEYLAELQRRDGTCFIETAATSLADECLVTAGAGQTSIMLVGDSYAAGFSRALRERPDVALSEFTSSSCPMNLAFDFPVRPESCRAINDSRYEMILAGGYDIVFIASWWSMQETPGQMKNLVATIEAILDNTASDIVLYGPSPLFNAAVPDIYRRKIRKGTESQTVEAMQIYPTDRSLMLAALGNNPRVRILDPVALFCDGTLICRYRDDQDLFFADNGHLSYRGIQTVLALMESR